MRSGNGLAGVPPPAPDIGAEGRFIVPGLERICSRMEAPLYGLVRGGFGIIILTHGLPKLLGESHGSMADPMTASTNLIRNVLGLPYPAQLAFLVMLLETVGAVFLAVGLFTRPVAIAITLEMVGISMALGPTWPWTDRGIEYPVLMSLLALYVAARGGGRYAVDRWLPYRL